MRFASCYKRRLITTRRRPRPSGGDPRRRGVPEQACVDDRELHTIKRGSDEPKLEIGETVLMNDGQTAIVRARYTPAAHQDEVRYIVQFQADKHAKRRLRWTPKVGQNFGRS